MSKKTEKAIPVPREILLNNIQELVVHESREMKILWANRVACERGGLSIDDIVGRYCYDVWARRTTPCPDCPVILAMETGQPHEKEVTDHDGTAWLIHGYPLRDADGTITGGMEISLNITDRKMAEQKLQHYRDQLEELVASRTRELSRTNQQLVKEMQERLQIEKQLKKRERQLEEKSRYLEEANTALRVLLEQREKDKRELEENVLLNVEKSLIPYLEKLRRTSTAADRHAYLDILESSMNSMVSPFYRNITLKNFNLTPREIEIAALIKAGKTSKEIALLLNLSPRTIDLHRLHIRQKLGLKAKHTNLRSTLLSHS
ncbi:MAG: PAS domain-containing protein [Deltaproteobacteria bacterium]|nr:PAS domain-containing protein [Candidatus Anaeroferrophillus wilburensis]MBN2890177.1 PAS domain-containing protein [Deltaproteobacteria bacterium]